MQLYNLLEYRDNYAKTPNNGNEKDAEIIVLLKYLNNFWRTLEMHLINGEVNLILT